MDTASRIQDAVQSITGIFTRKQHEGPAPILTNPIRYPFGEFEFQMRAEACQPVELQTSRDFRNWETLDTLTPAKDLSVVSDKKAGNYPALFYRAVAGSLESNYVGFLSLELPPGYSLLCNPLRGPFQTVGDLFPVVPEGCTLNRFSLVTFALTKNTFQNGKWANPAEALAAGEAVLFRNPTDQPVIARFVGDVPRESQTIPVQSGTSLRGALLPVAGRLDDDLAFPIQAGDVVSLYSNQEERYLEHKFTEAGWEGDAPSIRLGEGFWVAKGAAAIWTQRLPV